MAVRLSRPALRWLVPVSVAAVAVGGGAVTRAISASADASLPPRSAAQLLVDVQQARLNALSGTVVARADLGLPKLPDIGGQGSANLSALVSGSHTLRVWYAGPDKARVALLGTLGESDVIANGRDLWIWSSDQKSASHRTLPADSAGRKPGDLPLSPSAMPKTPQEAADRALAAIDPSTAVSTEGTAVVAGRPAYELVLAPRDTSSLVAQVRIALDGKRHIPLRVQVFAKGHPDPAAEIGFTQVSFTRPDDAQFRFTPPPGTRITQDSAAVPGSATPTAPLTPGTTAKPGQPGAPAAGQPEPVVLGTGWTTVVAARQPAPDAATASPGATGQQRRYADTTGSSQLDALLGALPRVSGSWGSGRLLSGRLFSVLLTDDGRILAGAVSPDRLYAAAADPKTLALRTSR